MKIDEELIYTTMLESLIIKYGLQLNKDDAAEALGMSARKLDENRRKGKDCPKFLDGNGRKAITFPVEYLVEFHLKESKNAVQTA